MEEKIVWFEWSHDRAQMESPGRFSVGGEEPCCLDLDEYPMSTSGQGVLFVKPDSSLRWPVLCPSWNSCKVCGIGGALTNKVLPVPVPSKAYLTLATDSWPLRVSCSPLEKGFTFVLLEVKSQVPSLTIGQSLSQTHRNWQKVLEEIQELVSLLQKWGTLQLFFMSFYLGGLPNHFLKCCGIFKNISIASFLEPGT